MPLSKATRSEITSLQLDKLRRLLSLVRTENAFYTQKLTAAGCHLPESFSMEDYVREIPLTTKEEFIEDQVSFPPFGSNLTFPLDQYSRYSQTSGTTGHPLRWLDTSESWSAMIENWLTVFQVSGISSKDRLFVPFSFGPFLGFWTAFEAATRLGCLCIPGGGLSTLARIKCIIDNGLNVLCCTPTYAIRLGIVATQEKLNLAKASVKSIIVAGEPGGSLSTTRERIESLWPGAAVIDHHGMTEIGPASYQCPERSELLHIIESSYYAEIIDYGRKKHVVKPGATGELIITTLDRTGAPVLRYRTGDLVRFGGDQRCSCGSYELALEGGILGRFDDMISVRGVNIFPSAIDNVVRSFADISEYRVQTTTTRGMVELSIQIEISPEIGENTNTCRDLENAILNAFAIRVPVSEVAPGTLPRFEMKAKRWVRL